MSVTDEAWRHELLEVTGSRILILWTCLELWVSITVRPLYPRGNINRYRQGKVVGELRWFSWQGDCLAVLITADGTESLATVSSYYPIVPACRQRIDDNDDRYAWNTVEQVCGRGKPQWSRKNIPQYHPTLTHPVLNASLHSHTKEISELCCKIALIELGCEMYKFLDHINPLNAELNPTCHLLALLGAHHILHVSRIRVTCYFTYDPVSKIQTKLCFRTAYDNGGDVARICCDVTFTSLALSHWRQEHRPCDADGLPCITHPSSAVVVLIQSLPLLSHLATAQDGP